MLSTTQKYAVATKLSISGGSIEHLRRGIVDTTLQTEAVSFATKILPLFRTFNGHLNDKVIQACK